MSCQKANVILVNLTLHNFAAGKPSVNGSVLAAATYFPVGYFMVVMGVSIQNTRAILV